MRSRKDQLFELQTLQTLLKSRFWSSRSCKRYKNQYFWSSKRSKRYKNQYFWSSKRSSPLFAPLLLSSRRLAFPLLSSSPLCPSFPLIPFSPPPRPPFSLSYLFNFNGFRVVLHSFYWMSLIVQLAFSDFHL